MRFPRGHLDSGGGTARRWHDLTDDREGGTRWRCHIDNPASVDGTKKMPVSLQTTLRCCETFLRARLADHLVPPTNTSVGLCDIVLPLTTVINDVTAPDEAFFGSIAQSSADGIGASSYPPHTD